MINWKRFGRKLPWPNRGYNPGIFLEELNKTKKIFNQGRWYTNRDSNGNIPNTRLEHCRYSSSRDFCDMIPERVGVNEEDIAFFASCRYRQYLRAKRWNPPIWLYDVIIQYNSIWVFNDLEVSEVILPGMFEFKAGRCILIYWKGELNTSFRHVSLSVMLYWKGKLHCVRATTRYACFFIRSLLKNRTVSILSIHVSIFCRSQWPRGLRHELSSLARKPGSWIRIPLKACMSVWVLFYVCVACM
jgi:hypothetical protein